MSKHLFEESSIRRDDEIDASADDDLKTKRQYEARRRIEDYFEAKRIRSLLDDCDDLHDEIIKDLEELDKKQ